jgi:hypothetical protein
LVVGNPRLVVIDGIKLVPPRMLGHGRRDCGCAFCGRFRAQHLVWRAIAIDVVALVSWILVVSLFDADLDNATPIIGGALIMATGATFAGLVFWYQPIMRLAHRRRPRWLSWPPPP